MSEVSGNEAPDDVVNDALIKFTACIGSALPDICSYSLTLGEAYVPFAPDEDSDCEDEDETACTQAWVRVMNVTPKQSAGTEGWGGDCAIVLEAELEVGVLRCIEVKDKGEAPTETEVMTYAMQSMSDMLAIHKAAMGCEVWESITTGQWQPSGPLGGQYGGTWTFTVEIDPGIGCV